MKRFIPPKIKELFVKLLKSNSSTPEVADGLAIGMFVAMLPIVGIQMYVSLILTRIFKKNSIIAMLVAWVTNPLTIVPIYLFNLWVGNLIYQAPISIAEIAKVIEEMDLNGMLHAGKDILIPLWLGSILVGIAAAFISQRLCLIYWSRIKDRFHHLTHHDEAEIPDEG